MSEVTPITRYSVSGHGMVTVKENPDGSMVAYYDHKRYMDAAEMAARIVEGVMAKRIAALEAERDALKVARDYWMQKHAWAESVALDMKRMEP
ncbi:hypothetical protein PQD74_gp063 [Stenotrophomonas phage Siara]|uniref:Uncharacterized protein n=1 Tax=Stenotrophomonas phage Siara TaxID=2859658 RepID=A0AAE7WMA5_9CAUD|nr:hypothetical protein PQD74_gp063 [Stenotrophomonas phage Siara]QYW02101.1 hypothetical protein CPT_Siara_101 [Stenotrophomonas phage Siara]